MGKRTFMFLLQKLRPVWKQAKRGRCKINLDLALYMTIWKLASGCTYREISNLFNVGNGAVFRNIISVTKILYSMKKDYIRWPFTMEKQQECAMGFQNLRKNPFPFVIGCVDGCHIPIIAPAKDAISYYNRKKFHSNILQGVCDSSLKFIDVFFGYPGSCHDALVWENSLLGKELKTGKRKLLENNFLLGDSAYPLSKYLIVPYRDKGHLTENQSKFNYIHSSPRCSIEQAFGRLKGMFRILKYVDTKNINYVKYIVMSCIVLHNFIIDHKNNGLPSTDNEMDNQNPNTSFNDESDDHNNFINNEEAKAIRDRLALLFSS